MWSAYGFSALSFSLRDVISSSTPASDWSCSCKTSLNWFNLRICILLREHNWQICCSSLNIGWDIFLCTPEAFLFVKYFCWVLGTNSFWILFLWIVFRTMFHSPKMATTSSSWMTSRLPVTMKQRESMLSPVWKRRSPGAEWLMVKCMARARKQPSLANRKAGCSLNTFRFRWTQISAFISFGQ